MANARIRNPVGCRLPKNTSLTRGGKDTHLILGPYTTGTALTLEPCMLVNVSNAGLLAKHTTKIMPAGVIIYDPRYNWGTTTPAIDATLPDYIEVYICARGPCLIQMDVSKVIDAAYLGAPVYESDTGGLCAIAATAAATVIGEAAHYMIGTLLDLQGGNTGTGTGGADGDLAEEDFRPFWGIVSTA
jgi:hypothetical protein